MADKETQLTPMDIHNKEFKPRGRNGYDRYEVDNFLDEVVDNYGDALDEVVDLKNTVISLNKKIDDLQAQVDEYNEKKKSLNKSLISAQQTADELREKAEAEAKSMIENAKKQVEVDTDYQKQQRDVIEGDYKRLKKQVGEFRSHIQAMLQAEIDNLNDEDWQRALDKYFRTDRFYPGGDAEPIPAISDTDMDDYDEDEDILIDDEHDEDIDNDDENDVNSSQDPDDEAESSAPQPMTGDSPNHETISTRDDTSKLNPTIVFPDDYKK